ncbi:MAG: hypothetical protein ACRD1S_04100 [Vicinamibacterales bacterium]
MAAARRLELQLLNVRGEPLGQQVDVMLRHLTTGGRRVARVKATRKAIISGLHDDGVYRVDVDPPSYLAAGAFVMLRPGGVTPLALRFPIDPGKVKRVKFPDYDGEALHEDGRRILEASDTVLGFEGRSGRTLYGALDDLRRAGFLNIVAKMAATGLTSGRLVSGSVQELTELRGDRFFAVVTHELREEVKHSEQAGLFEPAPDLLHHPPVGFERAGSFKTRDHYGNLQLSFFTNGVDWRADVDIDDANGLEHLFQVLKHQLSNGRTHPYDIRDILIAHQKLDPGYELVV